MADISEVLTSDNMRKVVEEEGLEARNLLNWNVIVSDKTLEVPKTSKKPPTSPRPQSASPKPPVSLKDGEPYLRSTNRCSSLGRPKSRLRSSSAGRNPEKCVRARYWAFLFENLYRAVDEIYQTCEVDESIVESKEAIMMLENYCKEFQALIQWLTISKNYEVTPPRNRPTSLAWDVRKSLPSKGLLRNIFLDKLGASTGGARKKLDFQGSVVLQSVAMQTEPEDPHHDKIENDESHSIEEEECAIDLSVTSKIMDDYKLIESNEQTNCDSKTEMVTEPVTSEETHVVLLNDQSIPEVEVTHVDEAESFSDEVGMLSLGSTIDVEFLGRDERHDTKDVVFSNSTSFVQDSETSCATSDVIDGGEASPEIPEPVPLDSQNNCSAATEVSETSIEAAESSVKSSETSVKSSETSVKSSETSVKASESSVKSSETSVKASETSVKASETSVKASEQAVVKEHPTIERLPDKEEEKAAEVPKAADCTPNQLEDKAEIVQCSSVIPEVKSIDVPSAVSQEVATPPVLPCSQKPVKSVVQKLTNDHPPKTQSAHTNKASKPLSMQANSAVSAGPVKPMTMAARIVKSVNSLSQPRTIVRTGPQMRKSNDLKNVNVVNGNNIFRNASGTSSFRSNAHLQTSSSKTNIQKPSHQCHIAAPLRLSRPSEHHLGKGLAAVKSASCTSLAGSYSNNGKKSDSKGKDDADGWETVRGRTRCKNSPAKKIPPTNGVYDQAVAAKIIHSKIGGFPYTCTLNSQSLKKSTKPSQAAGKSETAKIENTDEKSVLLKSKDQKVGTKKISKENIKPDSSRKVTSGKLVEKESNRHSLITSKQARENKATILKASRNIQNIEKNTVDDSKNPHFRKSHSSLGFEVRKNIKSAKNSPTFVEANNTKNKSSSICHRSDSSDIEKSTPSADSSSVENSSEQVFNDPDSGISNGILEIDYSNHTDKSDDLQATMEDMIETTSVKKEIDISEFDASSDYLDEVISQDVDGLNDAETLELYEKMIREEAQEHIAELGLSWGDQMDLLDMELRTPGRALQMHEKLSSPFRKRTLAETIRRQEEKQLKAQEQREKFLEEKAQRFKDIQKKVEEIKALNENKQEQQRISLEQRLQRAEEKRKKELEKIVRKAHDEEEKVHEIAFINTLEAQNKRHDLISKEKDHVARLQDIQGERQRKLDEKAAKEAAAEERRKVLEAERQARLLEMQEKRKQRDLKIEQQLLEKEKERQELSNQKARERELRISALNAAQQAIVEELQKKIQLKQEESARRHEENIELIRQKAFELSVRRYSSNNDDAPQHVPYETKKICTICNVLIASEVYLLSHLRGKKHQEMISVQHQGQNPSTEELELYNLKHIVNATTDQIDPNIALDKERLKALKKRCKKLRQRMTSRGAEFEKVANSTVVDAQTKHKQKMAKLISDLKKYTVSTTTKGPWEASRVSAMERTYNELGKLLEKCTVEDKVDFRDMGGVTALMEVLIKISMPISNNNTYVPNKVIIQACKVTQSVFKSCHDNAIFVLLSNKIGATLDVVIHRLRTLIPDNFDKLVANSATKPGVPPVDEVAGQLMCCLATVLDCLAKRKIDDSPVWCTVMKEINENQEEEFQLRINDAISYIVSIGIVDRLSQYFNSVRAAVDSEPNVATFLLHSMSFLMALVKMSSDSYIAIFESKKTDDVTQLLATLKMTDLVGVVSLLYCILLHGGSPSLDDIAPPELPEHTLLLTLAALRMLNHSAVLNLHMVQNTLGSEGLSLQLRHIMNYLIWYCHHRPIADLLHEVILLLGFFTALNPDNQLIIQAGQSPSVLKQLSTLPFNYFSDRSLTDILFPTLISCCFNSDANKAVIQREMSIELLSHYVEGYLLDVYNSSDTKKDLNIRWRLNSRFPKCKWTSAKSYFSEPIKDIA